MNLSRPSVPVERVVKHRIVPVPGRYPGTGLLEVTDYVRSSHY